MGDGADPVAFKTAVEALSPNVQKVDVTSLYSEKTINKREIQEGNQMPLLRPSDPMGKRNE